MRTNLNKTTSINLINRSGQSVSKGDVVVLSDLYNESFYVTGSQALVKTMGVVLDDTIANGENGMIALDGYVPQINLVSGSSPGYSFCSSSTAKQALPHSVAIPGDFGMTLGSGTTPSAVLWGPRPQFLFPSWQTSSIAWKIGGSALSYAAGSYQYYLHVGNLVFLQAHLITATTATGDFTITGFPKPIDNTMHTMGYCRFMNQGTAFHDLFMEIGGTDTVTLYRIDNFVVYSATATTGQNDTLELNVVYKTTTSA